MCTRSNLYLVGSPRVRQLGGALACSAHTVSFDDEAWLSPSESHSLYDCLSSPYLTIMFHAYLQSHGLSRFGCIDYLHISCTHACLLYVRVWHSLHACGCHVSLLLMLICLYRSWFTSASGWLRIEAETAEMVAVLCPKAPTVKYKHEDSGPLSNPPIIIRRFCRLAMAAPPYLITLVADRSSQKYMYVYHV